MVQMPSEMIWDPWFFSTDVLSSLDFSLSFSFGQSLVWVTSMASVSLWGY